MGQDKGEDMPLPFILGGLAIAAAGYGGKRRLMQRAPTMKLKSYSKKQRNC